MFCVVLYCAIFILNVSHVSDVRQDAKIAPPFAICPGCNFFRHDLICRWARDPQSGMGLAGVAWQRIGERTLLHLAPDRDRLLGRARTSVIDEGI